MTADRLTAAMSHLVRRLRSRFGRPAAYVRGFGTAGESSVGLLVWPVADRPTVTLGQQAPVRIDADARRWAFAAADLQTADGRRVDPQPGDRIVFEETGEAWSVLHPDDDAFARIEGVCEPMVCVYTRRVPCQS